jgi:hypothetical protein
MSYVRVIAAALALAVSSLASVASAQPTTPKADRVENKFGGAIWVRQTPDENGYLVTVKFHDNGVMTMVTVDPTEKKVINSGTAKYIVENGVLRLIDQNGNEFVRMQLVWIGQDSFRLVGNNGEVTTWDRFR